jgi:hypothetical protein
MSTLKLKCTSPLQSFLFVSVVLALVLGVYITVATSSTTSRHLNHIVNGAKRSPMLVGQHQITAVKGVVQSKTLSVKKVHYEYTLADGFFYYGSWITGLAPFVQVYSPTITFQAYCPASEGWTTSRKITFVIKNSAGTPVGSTTVPCLNTSHDGWSQTLNFAEAAGIFPSSSPYAITFSSGGFYIEYDAPAAKNYNNGVGIFYYSPQNDGNHIQPY